MRLHPAAHPFSQKAKNVTRYTHSFAICAEDKIREKLDGGATDPSLWFSHIVLPFFSSFNEI